MTEDTKEFLFSIIIIILIIITLMQSLPFLSVNNFIDSLTTFSEEITHLKFITSI